MTRIEELREQLVAHLTKASGPVAFTAIDEALGWPRRTAYRCCRGGAGKADSDPKCLVTTGIVELTSVDGALAARLIAKTKTAKKAAPTKKATPKKKAAPKK